MRKSKSLGSVPAAVSALFPKAPRIGSKVKVFLGVVQKRGKILNLAVREKGDVARTATLVGYTIEFGESCGFSPRNYGSVNVLAEVVLASLPPSNDPLRTPSRRKKVHISCLSCIPVSKQ